MMVSEFVDGFSFMLWLFAVMVVLNEILSIRDGCIVHSSLAEDAKRFAEIEKRDTEIKSGKFLITSNIAGIKYWIDKNNRLMLKVYEKISTVVEDHQNPKYYRERIKIKETDYLCDNSTGSINVDFANNYIHDIEYDFATLEDQKQDKRRLLRMQCWDYAAYYGVIL